MRTLGQSWVGGVSEKEGLRRGDQKLGAALCLPFLIKACLRFGLSFYQTYTFVQINTQLKITQPDRPQCRHGPQCRTVALREIHAVRDTHHTPPMRKLIEACLMLMHVMCVHTTHSLIFPCM